MTHKLVISSLNDAILSCSCGGWHLTQSGEMTKPEAIRAHRQHLRHVASGKAPIRHFGATRK